MVVTGAGLVSLAGCAGGGSSLVLPKSGSNSPTNLANFKRLASYKARGTVSARNTSVIHPICTEGDCGAGDGGGDIYTDPTAYHVRAVASDGSYALANYDAGAAAQISITSSDTNPAINTTATQTNPAADYGVQQVTTYANGSQLTRTVSDVNNGSGTFVDPQGNVWTISMYVDANQITINYSGPQTGTFTMSIGDFAYSSVGRSASSADRQISKCSETTRKGAHSTALAFDAAGLILVGLGLGAPFGVISGIIGLAIGLYSYYC